MPENLTWLQNATSWVKLCREMPRKQYSPSRDKPGQAYIVVPGNPNGI